MNDDDLERTLRAAFDAHARASVDDATSPPPPRFAETNAASRRRLRTWAAPLAAAAAVVAVVAAALGVAATSDHGHSAAASNSVSAANAVHVRLLNDDGATYGVGMPVIAFFSKRISDGRALQRATVATVDGRRVDGAWYFEPSAAGKGPIEGHFRMDAPWPSHSEVRVSLPIAGLPAGGGLRYDDNLTTDFHTGATNIAVVHDSTHTLRLTSDGAFVGSYRVSLGASATPTRRGIKVIMEKGGRVSMSGPGYNDPAVKYTQRLTYDGEYLHAAPWNARNIAKGVDSSNGCTNLGLTDARKLYGLLRVGDLVEYLDAKGPAMQLASGYGDWNVTWKRWLTGGTVPTR
jgi:lipoprotein-anchoring transpeptidase ErfK/SrfK